MSEKIKKVPKLRFPEFTDTWEQCKLGEVLIKNNNKNKELLYSNVESVSNKHGFIKQSEQFENHSVASEDLSNYYIISRKQFAYNPSRINVGSIAYKKENEEISIVSPLYVSFWTNEKLEDRYLWYWFQTSDFERQRVELSEGGVRDTLAFTQLSEMKININSLKEQEKIGNFFKSFDDLITTHQRKLENLKKQKKSLLQKMFPKNGNNFPEIRFPEFTDAWEQCKLGEVGEFSKGNGYTKNDLVKIGIPIVLYGQLYTNYETIISNISTFVELKENSIFSTGNEILIPASGETAEDIARASVIKEKNVLLGGDLNIIKLYQKINSIFLAFNLSNGELKKELSSKAQGKSIVHLHSSEIKKVNFKYPSLKEQEKIGNFFKSFDDLITTHQRKLENLKKLKKGLLQQMFI